MKQKCFVIMDYSDKYRAVYEKAIKPAVERSGLECIRADEILKPSTDLLGRLFHEIQQAAIIIADLTGNNINVAYEIGYAHNYNIKTLLLLQSGRRIPFDFRNQTVQRYKMANEADIDELREYLETAIHLEIESDAALLRKIMIPRLESPEKDRYAIVASPLTFQDKKQRHAKTTPRNMRSYGEYVGVTGLIQAFGVIFELKTIPALVNPRDFRPEPLEADANLYLLGSSKSNLWTRKILERIAEAWTPSWQFQVDPESPDLKDPWISIMRNDRLYEPDATQGEKRYDIDFGLVLRASHPAPEYRNKIVLVLAGRTALGTAAACMAVTQPKHIKDLLARSDVMNTAGVVSPFWAIVSIRRKGRSYVDLDDRSFRIEDSGILTPRS